MARRNIRPSLWLTWLWFLGTLMGCAALNFAMVQVSTLGPESLSLLASPRLRRALTLGLVELALLPWVMREHARRSAQAIPLPFWIAGWLLSWVLLVLVAELFR